MYYELTYHFRSFVLSSHNECHSHNSINNLVDKVVSGQAGSLQSFNRYLSRDLAVDLAVPFLLFYFLLFPILSRYVTNREKLAVWTKVGYPLLLCVRTIQQYRKDAFPGWLTSWTTRLRRLKVNPVMMVQWCSWLRVWCELCSVVVVVIRQCGLDGNERCWYERNKARAAIMLPMEFRVSIDWFLVESESVVCLSRLEFISILVKSGFAHWLPYRWTIEIFLPDVMRDTAQCSSLVYYNICVYIYIVYTHTYI